MPLLLFFTLPWYCWPYLRNQSPDEKCSLTKYLSGLCILVYRQKSHIGALLMGIRNVCWPDLVLIYIAHFLRSGQKNTRKVQYLRQYTSPEKSQRIVEMKINILNMMQKLVGVLLTIWIKRPLTALIYHDCSCTWELWGVFLDPQPNFQGL